MTVDQREDGCHVCFMHDWSGMGVSVTNAIERLATAVYREVRAIAEQQAPRARGMRSWFRRHPAARAQPAALDPARFHFYQHIPPHGSDMWVQFDRVNLSFRDGEYHAPKWAGYRLIPKVIQSARFNCARDVLQSNAQPKNVAISDQRAKEGEG